MFSNKEALERIEQAHGAKIDKMFWIAGSLESRDLKDLIEEMDDKAFKKCFPTLADCPYLEEYRNDDEILQALESTITIDDLLEWQEAYQENPISDGPYTHNIYCDFVELYPEAKSGNDYDNDVYQPKFVDYLNSINQKNWYKLLSLTVEDDDLSEYVWSKFRK